MTLKYTNTKFLEALQKRILVFDGAMGTSLQKMDLKASHFGGEKYMGCNDHLVLSYPQAVETVHRSYLDVGADALETCTFRANRLTLGEYGLQDKVIEINQAAAVLARRLVDSYSTPEHPRFLAGSIGPSGKLPSADDPELSNISYDQLAEIFKEQAAGLLKGGVDLIVVETSQDILEVKATIDGIQQAFSETGICVPIQAQVTMDTTGRMLLGTDIAAVLSMLEGLPIEVIGLNCSTGPEHMREAIRFLGEQSTLHVSCIPNAGLPINVDGQAVYPLEPEPFASDMVSFVEKYHVNVVGGCCGTNSEHIKLLVERLGGRPASPRPAVSTPRLSSPLQATPMEQEPKPLLIGERMNSQGSRAFKRLLMAEDYDSIVELARQQVANGAHTLDVCVALTERADEPVLMKNVVKKVSMAVEAPLVIDTTEPDVLETALKTTAGRCLINSTNLEGGRAKADRVLGLAKQHNAAIILLTIDEQGMAKTADRKLEIAHRLYHIAVDEHGLRPADLVFDALTFTLATGDPEFSRSAIETFEAIRRIKEELPGVFTSLGVSNASFGLSPAARPVLNSVMLYHAVQAGLDMAIVNPAQITPYPEIPEEERQLADDLIFNRRPDALQHLIEYFQKFEGAEKETADAKEDPTAGMSPEQRLHWHILHRHKDGVEACIDEILARSPQSERSASAVEILNQVLLPAMKEVGDKFGAGELILPFVLQSAEVMKKSVSHLEQFLERKEGTSKGLIVLATVYGDVHDIGKNLVKTILSNNGYSVIDLGKQVPADTIIQKAIEVKADAIGLSALLVSTSKQMPLIVNELQNRKIRIPVLVGGAAINRRFGSRILHTDTNGLYEPGVFYCKDAFEGLSTMDALGDPPRHEKLLQQIRREAEMELDRKANDKAPVVSSRSNVQPASRIPKPPRWGVHVVRLMPLDSIFECLAKNELFRLSWGAKNTHGESWEELQEAYEVRLKAMQKEAKREGWLKPEGIYGYFPAQADGNDLVVYSPESVEKGKPVEIERFVFPRQMNLEFLSLADYFAPVGGEVMDMVAFQVVTVGHAATERFDRLQAAGGYTEAYFSHGLAVQTAEATAEYLHRHIRRELGMEDGQGKRYSWGYPAIPELADHARVFHLLPAEKELGMSLTSAFQLVPEQSTAAIIVHHPAAKYFNIGESRVEQLSRA